MRNLAIEEIVRLMQLVPINYDIEPWDQWSNKELLEFYGHLRIEEATEEYDD
jgi:hypothetical protein